MPSPSSSPERLIQDIIMFYVKENYNTYLKENNISSIKNEDIKGVINEIYTNRKEHLKDFIKQSMMKIMGEEYIGDLIVNNILIDIFRDDDICKRRLHIEIEKYQKKKN